jgi:hypothetical protein
MGGDHAAQQREVRRSDGPQVVGDPGSIPPVAPIEVRQDQALIVELVPQLRYDLRFCDGEERAAPGVSPLLLDFQVVDERDDPLDLLGGRE